VRLAPARTSRLANAPRPTGSGSRRHLVPTAPSVPAAAGGRARSDVDDLRAFAARLPRGRRVRPAACGPHRRFLLSSPGARRTLCARARRAPRAGVRGAASPGAPRGPRGPRGPRDRV